jgi:hypothetical protein
VEVRSIHAGGGHAERKRRGGERSTDRHRQAKQESKIRAISG